MAPKHYDNMRDAALSDYITPDTMRLIAESCRSISGGCSEIPLEIQLQPKTAEKLSYHVPWDGVLDGFVRGREPLRQKLGLSLPLQSATISDWNEGFVLIFETADAAETAAFRISEQDVLNLLENCRRPPEMEAKK